MNNEKVDMGEVKDRIIKTIESPTITSCYMKCQEVEGCVEVAFEKNGVSTFIKIHLAEEFLILRNPETRLWRNNQEALGGVRNLPVATLRKISKQFSGFWVENRIFQMAL